MDSCKKCNIYDTASYSFLRLQRIQSLLDSAQREEHFFFGIKLIICFQLSSGAIISGASRSEIDKEDFDLEVARKTCFDDAVNQLARLEEYRVYEQNYHYLRRQHNRQ